MDKEKFEKANSLMERIKELIIMQTILNGFSDVFISMHSNPSINISLSHNMKKVLLKLCIEEKSKYEKEFKEL